MSVVSIGQITLMDFNDAVTLTGYISSNHSKSVKYDGNAETYSPDFPTVPLILTPSLYKAGSATDIMISGTDIKSVVWTRKSNLQTTEESLSTEETVGSSYPKALTISSQPFGATVYSIEYICTITYTDPTTGLDLIYKNAVTFNKVTDGSNIAIAEITADPGFAFKNEVPTSTVLSAVLYRGITKDTTNLTYEWQELIGSTWTAIDGATEIDYTVTQTAVVSMQQYRVIITDTVIEDDYTSAPVTILDFNDPIQCIPSSSNGIIFKNGVVSTDITAHLYQDGVEVDEAGTKYTYTWSKTDKDGDTVAFGTGKTKAVGSVDVLAKASFECTVAE